MQINSSSLEAILESRENRAKMQQSLISEFGLTVVSFTLNIPGPIKDKPLYRKIFDEGVAAITKALGQNNIKYQKKLYLKTGPEAYFSVASEALKVKTKAAMIEEIHPLGRIFDLDVFDSNNTKLSRSDISQPERYCIICEEKAAICARSRKHSLEELIGYIEGIAKKYFS